MIQAEKKRTAAVKRYLSLKISKEKEINEIINLAAEICNTPTALVTFIDSNTQHIKYKVGFKYDKTDRNTSFCTHVIEQHGVMLVPDALKDERFSSNPLVNDDPFIRFYAGSPLTTKDGLNLGALCVIDQKPKTLNKTQIQLLNTLSKQVVTIFEFESIIELLNEQFIETKNSEIKIRSFFESSMTCHLLIDTDFKVVYFNKALADSVYRAYKRNIAKGMNVVDFIPPQFADAFVKNFKTALTGKFVESERMVDFGHETICWYITYEPAYNTEGEIVGVSYNTMDITEKALQREKILEQNRSLRAIAQIQSHDLRGPVASLIGLFDVWRGEKYHYNEEIIGMMECSVKELDEKIREIIDHTPL